MSGLLLGMVLSVGICWFHSMVTLPPRLVSTDFGTCSYYYYYYYLTAIWLTPGGSSAVHIYTQTVKQLTEQNIVRIWD
jgi:hypothetical protein